MTTKYRGLTQEQIIQVVNQSYMDFRSTFEKPSNMVSLDEVAEAYKSFIEVSKELRLLVGDEIEYWYQFRNDNSAWSDWNKTKEAIHATVSEAFEIYETKDWSKYER